jgi:DNA-binding response OmpR family regulator
MNARPLILLVDDDPVWSATLADYLDRHDLSVMTAPDDQTALDILRRQSVGLVLLDFHLGRVDGLSVLRRLKAEGPRFPVMLLSSDSDPELPRRALAAGARIWLPKSTAPRVLLKAIQQALTRPQASATRRGHQPQLPVLRVARQFLPAPQAGTTASQAS